MPLNENVPREQRCACSRPFRTVPLAACLLMLLAMLSSSAASFGEVVLGISVTIAPPPLPVYSQPLCPAAGYIWTPGYWAWDPVDGYYWVPGTWVDAPFVGALWTPGYWGWADDGDAYIWHSGYWGPEVGFYGGIDYGFGYIGTGYFGGYWGSGGFYYNTAVNNISTTNITNVYTKTVVNNITVSHVSYNGGQGGITAQPTAAQLAAARMRRDPALAAQVQHQGAARRDPAQFLTANHGQPQVAATSRPGALSGRGVVRSSRAGGRINLADYSTARNRAASRGPATRSRAANQRVSAPAASSSRTTQKRVANTTNRTSHYPVRSTRSSVRSTRTTAPPHATVSRSARETAGQRSSETGASRTRTQRTAPVQTSSEREGRRHSTPQRRASYSTGSNSGLRTHPLRNAHQNTARAPRAAASAPRVSTRASRTETGHSEAPARHAVTRAAAPPPTSRHREQSSAGRAAPRTTRPPVLREQAPRTAPPERAPQRQARPQSNEKKRPPQ